MSETKQLASEADRSILRDYLTRRLKVLRRSRKNSGEGEEEAYASGGEMEILYAFDDLLGEEAPDLRKKPVAQ